MSYILYIHIHMMMCCGRCVADDYDVKIMCKGKTPSVLTAMVFSENFQSSFVKFSLERDNMMGLTTTRTGRPRNTSGTSPVCNRGVVTIHWFRSVNPLPMVISPVIGPKDVNDRGLDEMTGVWDPLVTQRCILEMKQLGQQFIP